MHKLISRGAKFLSFSFPKTHFIPRIKFSSQIDSHLQGADQLTISKNLYSEEEYRKIEEIQQMPYQVLLEEVKKYSNRPKTRAKNNLIQFLIAQVPKKGVINENNSFTQELELDENQIITHHRHDYAHNHNEESYAADTEEAIKILRENSLFNDLKFEIGLFGHRLTPPIAQKTLPYLENYPEKQLLDHINSLSNVDLKREMEQLIHRSPLYSKIPLVKVKKLAKDDLSSSFKDMLFVHRDYAHLHRNFLKHILADPKGKLYTTLDCLEALRSLERSTNLARWHTYLQTLSPNALIRFWSVVFESIDKYDLQTLDLVLSIALKLKEEYSLNFSDRGNENEIYEVIFNRAANLVQDPNQSFSISSLAGLINSSRIVQVKTAISYPQVQNLGNVLIQKYTAELLDIDFQNLALSPRELLGISTAVIYIGGAELPNLLPDIFKKLRSANLRNFEKHYLREFLVFLSNMKINPPKEFVEDVRDNPKIMENLTLFDIYLYLHTFKEAKVEFAKTYFHLYYAFFSLLDPQVALSDMKKILLTAKTMNYILENHLSEHRKNTLEKKANFVLMLIEKSIDMMEETPQVIDLIEISSLFIPHLNFPDFLFRKILLQIDELSITNENKNKISRFVHKYLDKIAPKYTFNTYLTSTDLEFNDKISEFTIPIFKRLVQKFRQSNLLSYIMLNIRIACHPSFFQAIIPDAKERQAFLEYLLKQIVGFSANATSVGIPHIKTIIKFIQTNIKELNPNYVVAVFQKLVVQILQHFSSTPTRFNDTLEWIYLVSTSCKELKVEVLNPVNAKQLSVIQKNLRDFTNQNVLNPFCENSSLTIQQIIYDKDVSQYFNPSVFNTNFEHLEYLLPSLDALDISLTPIIERNIISQFPKCIKRWHGKVLVDNLLVLDKFKIHCPELFEYSIPNLFSCFIFYFDMQNLTLNKEVLDEKRALDLLRTFVNQKEAKYFKDINDSIGQTDFSQKNSSLIPLGALLYKAMHLLMPEDIIKIVNILGNERKNYMQAFIVKFNHLKFKSLPPEEALNLKAILPAFLQNEELNKIAENYIQKNKQNTKKIFTVMRKEKLWIEEIIPKIIDEIRTTKSIALFDNLLEYLSEAGIYYKDFETIIKLVQELGLSFAEMSNDAKVNMLTYFYIQQIQANANDSKNLKIYSENQQAFLKQLCKSLLRSEYFHFFENVVVHDGNVVKIKYYGSFELGQDLMSNTFKVFPKNKMGTIEEFDSSHSSENDLFITQTGASEENLFETSKAFEEQTIRSDYKKITRQFMLYNQYHEHAELPPENEQLEQEFIDLQNKNFNLVKFKENFANFLIDITLILHEFGLLYKTNLECEQSKILVDIALVDQKTAIIFVDQQETIYELQNDGRIYHPDNFNKMKIDTLRKKGWNVIPVIYESWNNEFDTKEKKEYYIKKKIDAFGKANI